MIHSLNGSVIDSSLADEPFTPRAGACTRGSGNREVDQGTGIFLLGTSIDRTSSSVLGFLPRRVRSIGANSEALFGKIRGGNGDAEASGNSLRRLTREARIDSTEGATMADKESTGGRVRCGGCPQTWTALGAAHCAANGCHLTFSSVSSFDKHRAGHECRLPQDVGLELNKRGMWAWPSDESGDSRFNRLPQSAEPALSGVTGPEAA